MSFTMEELLLLERALDSHKYWEVCPPLARSAGQIVPELLNAEDAADVEACDRLTLKVIKERIRLEEQE